MALQGWLWASDANAFVENLRGTEAKVLHITPEDGDLRVEVEYFNEIGVRFTKEFAVDDRSEPELRQIGKMSLVFDRRFPEVAELGHVVSANNERLLYWAMALAGILLFIGGGFILCGAAMATLGTMSLFRRGQITQTEVRDGALAPGKSVGRFTYAFRGADGRWYEGRSPEMHAAELAEWPTGKRILVAFDAANPRRNEADVFGVIPSYRPEAIEPV